MDAFQHVNNTQYFRYFEDVRIAYFEATNIAEYMEKHRIGPILAATQCRFKAPLRYPDTVHIGTRVHQIETDRFSMEYLVVSERLNKIAAVGDGLVVCYDYSKEQKTPIPQSWRESMQQVATRGKTTS